MAPEQIGGDLPVDRRADIYSLGAVLYEMLTGRPPHVGGSTQCVIARVLTRAATPVTALRPDAPAAADALLARALEKDPANRFATAGDFGRAIGASLPMTTA
jgi:eukaryotic-like serine/threonine-protein kinase